LNNIQNVGEAETTMGQNKIENEKREEAGVDR
jgi:hypothetical protein